MVLLPLVLPADHTGITVLCHQDWFPGAHFLDALGTVPSLPLGMEASSQLREVFLYLGLLRAAECLVRIRFRFSATAEGERLHGLLWLTASYGSENGVNNSILETNQEVFLGKQDRTRRVDWG